VRAFRWLAFSVTGLVLVGLTACSTGSTTGGASGGGTTVTVTVAGTVQWLAAQDGSAAWEALSGPTFTVTDPAGKYGVAWECTSPSTSKAYVTVLQATTAEGTGVTASCQAVPNTTYSMTGTVSGIPSGGSAFVAFGPRFTVLTPYTGTSVSYTLTGIPAGVHTAVVYGLDGSGAPATMVVLRDVTVNGDVTWSPDLSAGTVFTLKTLSLTGTPSGENPGLAVGLTNPVGGFTYLAQASGTSLSYPVVPTSLARTTDSYLLAGGGSNASASQFVDVKSQGVTSGTGLQLPPALSTGAGITLAGSTATANWGSVSIGATGGLAFFTASVAPGAFASPTWTAELTGGWLGSASSYTFPDVSSTAGWNASWDFPIGQTNTEATVTAYDASLSLSQLAAFNRTQDYASLPDGTRLEGSQLSAYGTY
jgi:hypothetical protein